MKKYFSLIKSTLSEDMNVFKISTKKKNNFTKIVLPIIISLLLMGTVYSYAYLIIEQLSPINMEFVLLSLFIIVTSLLALIEGIYKSGSLLFNCKDDNLLLSLPINKGTVLFIRVFKFYIFELLYNTLFILPAIVCYAIYTNPSISFYIITLIGLLLFPIVPILISCIIGTVITTLSSKFKGKNIVQTIITFCLLLGVMYLSYNSENLIANIANNAKNINDFITKLYYPAGAYIELISSFNAVKMLEFVLIHLGIFILSIYIIGKIYFKINSSTKSVKTNKNVKGFKIKSSSPIRALIKKEFSRFISSTVFVTNAGLGLILFIIACVMFVIKFDTFVNGFTQVDPTLTMDYIKNIVPIVLFGLICFASFMTSITSSMISLEGKSFSILKSLPVKPYTIVQAKVLSAVLIMIPCIVIGDIIIFVKFSLDFFTILLLLIASVILPLLTETIGIIVNLKYPRMDAKNDTEIVKQSMSSGISVFIGMILVAATIYLLYKALEHNISNNIILIAFISAFTIIYALLLAYLNKTAEKSFNNITV